MNCLPVDLGPHELVGSRVPETQHHREEREKDGWDVVGIAARDGQLGREAKAGPNYRDEEWQQDVADVACLAQVPRLSRERCLASPGEDDALRDGRMRLRRRPDFTNSAFPTPKTHAVPAFQPLVPRPDRVMNDAGCVCLLRPSTRPNTTKKPVTARNRAARVILGTILGHKNKGEAVAVRQPHRTYLHSGQNQHVIKMVARKRRWICQLVASKVSSQKLTKPATKTAHKETPEEVTIHQPSRVIQPTTNAANLLWGPGAKMKKAEDNDARSPVDKVLPEVAQIAHPRTGNAAQLGEQWEVDANGLVYLNPRPRAERREKERFRAASWPWERRFVLSRSWELPKDSKASSVPSSDEVVTVVEPDQIAFLCDHGMLSIDEGVSWPRAGDQVDSSRGSPTGPSSCHQLPGHGDDRP
ncbi:MAG: hypothetical protein Q9173_006507 [Seirophora scorigena]